MNASTPNHPTLFLLEPCDFTRRAVAKVIETSLPECQLLLAENLAEAQSIGAQASLDLFIIGSRLPDGSGIDFLADMMMVHENAHFILLADGPLPDHLDSYRWLDQAQILRKPVDRVQLLAIMRAMIGEKGPRPVAASHGAKKVSCIRLKDVSAEDLVHLKIEAKATTVLEFVSRGESGQIHFINGRAMYAEAGRIEGKDALAKIMNWKSGFAFEIEETTKPAAPEPPPVAAAQLSGAEKVVPPATPAAREKRRGAFRGWINRTTATLARAIRTNRTAPPAILTEANKP
jgi:DNA-binding NarL/FixJ family response regulator